jgi:hypothetical protein
MIEEVVARARRRRRPVPADLRPPLDVCQPRARGGHLGVELARIMGTSVRMIEMHYGALLQGSARAIRARLDALENRLGQKQATEAEA